MRLKKYSAEQLKEAVKVSFSYRSALKILGVVAAGGNYEIIKKAIKYYSIDVSHFTGKGHLRGKKHAYRIRPLEEILKIGCYENTYRLKNRLLKDGVKKAECENCGRRKWLGKPIPLELHHENGDRQDNRLANLTVLCPNCHAFTGNYRRRNHKCVETI